MYREVHELESAKLSSLLYFCYFFKTGGHEKCKRTYRRGREGEKKSREAKNKKEGMLLENNEMMWSYCYASFSVA